MQNTKILLYFLVLKTVHSDSNTIEYYKNLINESIEKTKSYKLPTDNMEFKLGIQSTEIKGNFFLNISHKS